MCALQVDVREPRWPRILRKGLETQGGDLLIVREALAVTHA